MQAQPRDSCPAEPVLRYPRCYSTPSSSRSKFCIEAVVEKRKSQVLPWSSGKAVTRTWNWTRSQNEYHRLRRDHSWKHGTCIETDRTSHNQVTAQWEETGSFSNLLRHKRSSMLMSMHLLWNAITTRYPEKLWYQSKPQVQEKLPWGCLNSNSFLPGV